MRLKRECNEATLLSETFWKHLYYTPKRFGCQGFWAEISLKFALNTSPIFSLLTFQTNRSQFAPAGFGFGNLLQVSVTY